MTRRATAPQSEWDRAMKCALKHLPVGSFKIGVENGHPCILPVSLNEPPVIADDGDDWDEALDRWRHSA